MSSSQRTLFSFFRDAKSVENSEFSSFKGEGLKTPHGEVASVILKISPKSKKRKVNFLTAISPPKTAGQLSINEHFADVTAKEKDLSKLNTSSIVPQISNLNYLNLQKPSKIKFGALSSTNQSFALYPPKNTQNVCTLDINAKEFPNPNFPFSPIDSQKSISQPSADQDLLPYSNVNLFNEPNSINSLGILKRSKSEFISNSEIETTSQPKNMNYSKKIFSEPKYDAIILNLTQTCSLISRPDRLIYNGNLEMNSGSSCPLPTYCTFSNGTHTGYNKAAFSDESGYINIFNTSSENMEHIDFFKDTDPSGFVDEYPKNGNLPILSRFKAHENSIFTFKFLNDDESILTSSADCTIARYDLETSKKLETYRGHTEVATEKYPYGI
ncbi:hypothetical protein AYI68_g331 [Smittium mucronatum]|uniref:Uncharacterized protein n=1 Tax=Smittium mucronatum TaxID=133383 RepID=A0A1R0H8H1_9FUNG|nr:hypothetical protein AYI68_g331 [Smittium mucronatum]